MRSTQSAKHFSRSRHVALPAKETTSGSAQTSEAIVLSAARAAAEVTKVVKASATISHEHANAYLNHTNRRGRE